MKQSIIGQLAKDKTVEGIIQNIAKENDEDYKDLAQDIYMELLEKDEETIEGLYEKKQLNFYLTRMVINNIQSKTSRFFYKYRKNKINQVPIDDYWKNLEDYGQ